MILTALLSLLSINPANCQQKDEGFASWSNPRGALVAQDGLVSLVTVTNPFPEVISNPLHFYDFPTTISTKDSHVVVTARQAGTDNYGTWIVVTLHNEQGGLRTLAVAEWQHVTTTWTDYKFALESEVDWSTHWLSVQVITDLVSPASVEIDSLFVE